MVTHRKFSSKLIHQMIVCSRLHNKARAAACTYAVFDYDAWLRQYFPELDKLYALMQEEHDRND